MLAEITPTNARDFDRYSVANALMAEARSCNCKAYESIFTYKRWLAQGFQVRKGEKGTKIGTYAPIVKTDKETGEKKIVGKRPWTSTVFCKCQVDPIGAPTVQADPPAPIVEVIEPGNDYSLPKHTKKEVWTPFTPAKPRDGATVTDLTGCDFVLTMSGHDDDNNDNPLEVRSITEIRDTEKNVKVNGRRNAKYLNKNAVPIVLAL